MHKYVIPLDSYVKNWPELKDFIPVMLGDVKYQGHLYGLPTRLDFRTFIYNKQVFSAAGFDPNRAPQTWQQTADYATRLTKVTSDGKTEIAGINVSTGNSAVFTTMVRDEGGSMFNADKTKAMFDSPQGIEGLGFWIDLGKKLYGDKPVSSDISGGKTAMLFESRLHNPVGDAISAGVKPLDLLGFPPPPKAVNGYAHAFSNWMAISSQSKHPDLAWDFLALQFEPQNYIQLVAVHNGLPQTFSALKSDYVQSKPWMAQVLQFAAQYGRAEWTAKDFRDLKNALDPYLRKAAQGAMPVNAALHAAAKQWDQLLAKVN